MSNKGNPLCCCLLFGFMIFLLQTNHVSGGLIDVDERLNALEKQGAEQTQLLAQQAEEIKLLNHKLVNNQEELRKYKQQTEDQAEVIKNHDTQIQAHSDKLYSYKALILQNRKELKQYKTQIRTLTKHIEALQQVVRVDTSAPKDTLRQKSEHQVMGNIDKEEMEHEKERDHMNRLVKAPTDRQARHLRAISEGTVAFHATSDKGAITHVGTSQNIMLGTVLLNLGNGYHSQQGNFIAPVDGLYTFSISILSSNTIAHPEIQIDILKNGVILGGAYAHGDSGRHDQGAITVITQLVQGDEVWIRTNDIVADASYWGARFTAFSGYLICPN